MIKISSKNTKVTKENILNLIDRSISTINFEDIKSLNIKINIVNEEIFINIDKQ